MLGYGMDSNADPVDGEGRLHQRPGRQLQQHERVVVGSDTVAAKSPALGAPVNDSPLATLPRPNGDGLHFGPAVRRAVAGPRIEMKRMETVGAMVAVTRTGPFGENHGTAMRAPERLVELFSA